GVKEISYDSAGRVVDERFAEGKSEHYDYKLSGTTVTSVTVTDSLGRSTKTRFAASGYTIEMTDALGQTSRVERDLVTGLPTRTIGPCGCAEEIREFDERGNITARTDRLGNTSRFEYDFAFNNITKITDKLNRVTTLGYDARGNLTSIINPLHQQVTLEYDSFEELTTVINRLGNIRRLEYNATGNLPPLLDLLAIRRTLDY